MAVTMPIKTPTQMKKRGEMELETKYLSKIFDHAKWRKLVTTYCVLTDADDEPEPGPSCYFILTGFSSTEMLNYFASIKLKVDVLVKIMASKEAYPSHSDEDQGM